MFWKYQPSQEIGALTELVLSIEVPRLLNMIVPYFHDKVPVAGKGQQLQEVEVTKILRV